MASNKANTPHPPQTLNSQLVTGQLPVKATTYRAITELNAGFEKVIHEFGKLSRTSFLRSEALAAMYDQLWHIRARAIGEILTVLGEREAANAAHFERLCSERGISPSAVLSKR